MRSIIFKKYKKSCLLAAFLFTLSVISYANPPGGGGNPSDPGDGGDPDAGVPIDGGISLLLVAGAAYGARKIYKQKNSVD